MKIEIWSDIMCPFCYIGKRHLEAALQQFPNVDVTIEWKSFQLDASIEPQPGKDVYSYLAERKGMTVEQSRSLHQDVVERAAAVGLDYRFDKAIISNSWKAHQLIQLAKTKSLGDNAEEVFFKAYFTDGKDLNDEETLLNLAVEIGLERNEALLTLTNQSFDSAIRNDIHEAAQIGVRGVPFFVFDRKYAISGAQPIDYFIQTIEQVMNT